MYVCWSYSDSVVLVLFDPLSRTAYIREALTMFSYYLPLHVYEKFKYHVVVKTT
jgi:hypothetical protein